MNLDFKNVKQCQFIEALSKCMMSFVAKIWSATSCLCCQNGRWVFRLAKLQWTFILNHSTVTHSANIYNHQLAIFLYCDWTPVNMSCILCVYCNEPFVWPLIAILFKIQLFTGVFGVGPATARKWISNGLSTIEDALLDVDNLAKDDSRIATGNTIDI